MSTEIGYLHSIELLERDVTRDGQTVTTPLARMRINVDRSYYLGEHEGQVQFNDDKSFWVNAEMWGNRVNSLKGIVESGSTVMVSGRYVGNKWKDDQGVARSEIRMQADNVAIMPRCIESIAFKKHW